MQEIPRLTDDDFDAVQKIMYAATGVRLPATKKPLVVSRLRKRLEECKLKKYHDYLKLIQTPASSEIETFINAITTNETYFFRHPQQFDCLTKKVLPAVLERKKKDQSREIRIWSAACSTGEEPYTIAIVCNEFFRLFPGWEVVIYASDINSAVLDGAREAKYSERSLHKVPLYLKRRYFKALKENEMVKNKKFQLKQDVVQKVIFLKHNLMTPLPHQEMDIVFLRNVMIYFDEFSKQKVIRQVEDVLAPGGYFFISYTESLFDIQSHLQSTDTGIYKKQELK